MRSLINAIRGPLGRTLTRYFVGSVIAMIVSEATLLLVYGLHLGGARLAAVAAWGTGAIVNYFLNRNWAWGRRGRWHIVKEVIPYLAASVLGLVAAMWSVDTVSSHVKAWTDDKTLQVTLVAAAYVGTYASLWVLKFLFFNVLFARPHRHADADAPARQVS